MPRVWVCGEVGVPQHGGDVFTAQGMGPAPVARRLTQAEYSVCRTGPVF